MNNKLYILVMCLLFQANYIIGQSGTWNLKKEKNGVIVYTRTDNQTGNIEFKGIVTIANNIPNISRVFYEVDSYQNWIKTTKSSSLLKQVNDDECYVYYESASPWPFENRDIPIHQEITKTKNTFFVKSTGVPSFIPEKKGITRLKTVSGSWSLKAITPNSTKIIYRFSADPELNFPNWVIDLFIVDGPYESLINLKKMFEKP